MSSTSTSIREAFDFYLMPIPSEPGSPEYTEETQTVANQRATAGATRQAEALCESWRTQGSAKSHTPDVTKTLMAPSFSIWSSRKSCLFDVIFENKHVLGAKSYAHTYRERKQ